MIRSPYIVQGTYLSSRLLEDLSPYKGLSRNTGAVSHQGVVLKQRPAG